MNCYIKPVKNGKRRTIQIKVVTLTGSLDFDGLSSTHLHIKLVKKKYEAFS
jgi:hypothetical protein